MPRPAFFLMVLWASLVLPAGAALPDFLGGHTPEIEKRILIVKDSNHDAIQQVRQEPRKYLIVVVQTSPEKLTDDDASLLMAWVRQGGSLWFHDSRLAPRFGMEPDPLSASEVPQGKPHDDQYGDLRRQPGMAAIVIATGQHPVVGGVDKVAAFLMRVSEDRYSAVRAGDRVVGLLQASLEVPKLVAALRLEGQGRIVFKPLVWETNDETTTKRFQDNLRNWSAGYPLTDMSQFDKIHQMEEAGRQKPTGPAAYDAVTTGTGDVFYGTVQPDSFHCTIVSPGAASIRRIDIGEDVSSITFQDGRQANALVEFAPTGLALQTSEGPVRRFRKTEVVRIDLGVSRRL